MNGTMSASSRAASSLTNDPIISRSLNESLARMLRNVHEEQFSAGEVIYTEEADANFLYLLAEGSVELVSTTGKRITIESTRFGEEAATDVPHYLSKAIALTDVVVFAIPRTSLAGLNQYNPGHKAEFYFSLLANFGGEQIRRRVATPRARSASKKDSIQAIVLFAAILVPLLVFACVRVRLCKPGTSPRTTSVDRKRRFNIAIFEPG